MKLKIITIALLCAVLSASCGAEVEEPAHGTPLDEIEPEIIDEPEEIPEPEILEPLIIMSNGHDLFLGIYHINVISRCGAIKELEYEHDNVDEYYIIDMYKFANEIYKKMNDDSIPVVVQYDKTPENIIKLMETIEVSNLDASVGFGADNRRYYVIIGSDEDRQAVFIGGKWGSDGDKRGGNELTRAINEYLETTTGQIMA